MLIGPVLAVVTLSLGDTTSTTLRPRAVESGLAVDVQNSARSALTFGFENSSFALSYVPSFGVIDVARRGDFVLMQTAGANYAWWTRRLRLDLALTGSIGRQGYLGFGARPVVPGADLTNGGATPTPGGATPGTGSPPSTPDPNAGYLAQQDILYTGSLRVSLAVSYALSRRSQLAMSLGYSIAGGLGATETTLPLRRGPDGSAAWTYMLTHRDDLTTSVAAAFTEVPSRDSRFYTATALETWSHRFSVTTQGSIGAGLTYLQAKIPGTPIDRSLLAAGVANLAQTHKLEGHALLTLGVGAGLGTGYNQVLGTVTQVLSANARVGWTKDRTTLGATADAAESLPRSSPNASQVIGAGAVATYRVADPLSVMLGGRWTYQVLPTAALAAGAEPNYWQIFAGATLTAPDIVF